jgi:hypothetical protein
MTSCSCSKTGSQTSTSSQASATLGNNVPSGNIPQERSKIQNSDNNQKISDIQKPENVGKTVTVQGKVINTLQSTRYNISGYKIQDATGMIDVSSKRIPQINSTVTVSGKLMQTRFFGLVIQETE